MVKVSFELLSLLVQTMPNNRFIRRMYLIKPAALVNFSYMLTYSGCDRERVDVGIADRCVGVLLT